LCAGTGELPAKRKEVFYEWNEGVRRNLYERGLTGSNSPRATRPWITDGSASDDPLIARSRDERGTGF
jgi:hypothetical protein